MKQEKVLQRLISFPYLLCFLLFLFPVLTVSCSEKTVLEPTAYQLASGIDMAGVQTEDRLLETWIENMGAALNFEEVQIKVFYLIFASILLAAVCAFFFPFGSLIFGLSAFIGLWYFIYQTSSYFVRIGFPMISVKAGLGAYAVSMMLLVGMATSLAAVIRQQRNSKKQA
ncbi:MAG: hypothetical protein LBR60_07355 [Fibrobacter sp.]|nr:hypothetical protein [Fibrobacter sp.]